MATGRNLEPGVVVLKVWAFKVRAKSTLCWARTLVLNVSAEAEVLKMDGGLFGQGTGDARIRWMVVTMVGSW
jgi:hypothetical protein